MLIQKINVYPIILPFSAEFSHSLRKRSSVKNVVVEIIAEGGSIKGYGEGAPRSYVTGESQESVAQSINRLTQKSSFPWKCDGVSSIWAFIDSLPYYSDHNAAICVLETAFLDAVLEQSMNGLGRLAGGLRHAFGGPAGGRCQQHMGRYPAKDL